MKEYKTDTNNQDNIKHFQISRNFDYNNYHSSLVFLLLLSKFEIKFMFVNSMCVIIELVYSCSQSFVRFENVLYYPKLIIYNEIINSVHLIEYTQ